MAKKKHPPTNDYMGKLLDVDTQMNVRIKAGTHSQLKLAAMLSGRTLSDEVEHRLEMSFAGYTDHMMIKRRYDEINFLSERQKICESYFLYFSEENEPELAAEYKEEIDDLEMEIAAAHAVIDRLLKKSSQKSGE